MLLSYLSVIIINFLNIFKLKKNKIILLISLLMFVVLAGASTSDPDWLGYQSLYYSSINKAVAVEPGFRIFESIFLRLGFSYETFRIILSFVIFWYLFYILNKYVGKESISFFIVFYSLFSLFYDSIQLRNTIAFLFVLHGLYYLINDEKYGIKKYVLFIIIASSFQILMSLYIFFVIYKFKNKSVWLFFLIIISLGLFILIIINGMKIPFIDYWISGIMKSKFSMYIDETTRLGFLYPSALQVVNLLYIFSLSKLSNKLDSDNKKNMTFFMFINCVALIYVPLFTINLNMYRLSRNLIVANLICAQYEYNKLESVQKKKNIMIVSFIYILIWAYYGFIFNNEWESVVHSLLNNNSFFR